MRVEHALDKAQRAYDESLARKLTITRAVIVELNLLRDWIKSGDGYNREDAPDEIARAIANRIMELEARETNENL